MDCAEEMEEGDLPFIVCIIQDEQKADANVVLTCLEAAMHALWRQFPYLTKVIVQSNNACKKPCWQADQVVPASCVLC